MNMDTFSSSISSKVDTGAAMSAGFAGDGGAGGGGQRADGGPACGGAGLLRGEELVADVVEEARGRAAERHRAWRLRGELS